MVRLSVDELTIVILLAEKAVLGTTDWEWIAHRIIKRTELDLQLIQIFGPKCTSEQSNIAGYSIGYSYGNHPFYFRICYHEAYWNMGVAVKFSAQSLAYYCSRYSELTGTQIEVFQILQILSADFQKNYIVRLSRIDFCADFINEGMSVNELNVELADNHIHFEHSTGRRNTSKIAFYTDAGAVDTIYVGSKKANVTTFLRIYNKRKEQIQQHGIHFDEAINCRDWVRMENSIRGAYAHDITQRLLLMDSRSELVSLIAACILNKYSLVDEDGADHKITALLRSAATEPSDYYYSDTKYQDFSLDESLGYLVEKSGLMPFLYKAKQFDPDALTLFTRYLAEKLEQYSPTWSVTHWLVVHGQYYQDHGIKNVFATRKEKEHG